MRKRSPNKTVIRMLLSLAVMFILPVAILYFLYTSQISSAIEYEVREMVSNDLAASVKLIDSHIQTLNDTIKLFQRGKGYQSYLTNGFSYDDSGTSANSSLESDIPYIYLLNGADDDFFLYLPDADTVFATSGMHRSTSYFQKYYATPADASNPAYDVLSCTEATVRCDPALTTHRATAETLSFIYPLSKNTNGVGGTAVFCVQTARFNTYFRPRAEDFQTSTFIFNEDGTYLFSYNADKYLIHDVQTAPPTNETYVSASTGAAYSALRTVSELNGWQYLVLLPVDNTLYNNAFEINRFFQLYLLLTLLLGTLMLSAFLWLNYKPIFRLREQAKNMLIQNPTLAYCADDLDTIYRALDTLKTQNSSLNDSISHNVREIQAARLHRLLTNYYESIEEFNVDCEQLDLSFHGNLFYVSIILFSTPPEDMETFEALVLQEFPEAIETRCLYLPNQSRLVMIHCPQEQKINTDPFFGILGLLHNRMNIRAVIGVGRLHPGAESISKSYLQAVAALDYRTNKGSETVITYDEVLIHNTNSSTYPAQELQRLANALTSRNTNARDQSLTVLLKQMKLPETSLMNARCIAFDLIKILMSSLGVNQKATYLMAEALTQLNQEKTKQDVIRIVEKNYAAILSLDEKTPKTQPDTLLDAIKVYIQENYCRRDFSIQEIAEHFEMLPSNIGNYFKEQAGCGLLEYLIDLRIRRAKELLHATDMTVREISLSVGYYSDSSFIRRFKQHEGITPNEYRFKC